MTMRAHSTCSLSSGRALSSVHVLGMCAALITGGALLTAPAVFAQDAAAQKTKPVRPKAAAKAAEGDGGAPQATAPAKRDPALAQKTLDSGTKLLQAGKHEQAIQSFTTVINGGNLPTPMMAKALHQRGAAYRAAGKPAQAVSDLTSALWLKGGLTDAERTDAQSQRTAAYREAGLPDQSDSAPGQTPAAGPASTRRTAATAPAQTTPAAVGAAKGSSTPAVPPVGQTVTTSALAPEAPRPAQEATSPIGTFFNNLFGSGQSTAATTDTPAPGRPQQPATSGWSSAETVAPAPAPKRTTVAAAATNSAVAAAPAAAAKAPPTAKPIPAKAVAPPAAGNVHARLVSASEADAGKLAMRLSSEFGGQLGGRKPEVSKTQFGAMGTFFQVRVGPFSTQVEAQDFCRRIKGAGADCVPVTQ